MKDLPESAPATSDSTLGRLLLINGPLLGLVVVLLIAAKQEDGYMGGFGEMLAIFGLMGLGALLNLKLSATTKGTRVGYLLMAAFYGAVFAVFVYELIHMGNPKPGG